MRKSADSHFDNNGSYSGPEFRTDLQQALVRFIPKHQFKNSNYVESVDIENVAWPVRDVLIEGLLKKTYPRGIAWHDFPVVLDARYVANEQSYLAAHLLETDTSLSPYFIYEESSSPEYYLMNRYLAGHVFKVFGYDRQKVVARYWDEAQYSVQDGLMTAEGIRIADRLDYSYWINFQAIGLKALRQFTVDLPPLPFAFDTGSWRYRDSVASILQKREDIQSTLENFCEIKHLQLLYAIREMTDAEMDELLQRHFFGRDGKARGVGKYFDESGSFWVGTNKYMKRRIGIASALNDFFALGLLAASTERGIWITDNALRFLDALHKDNCDPDAMLRWGNDKDGIDPAQKEAVDAWLFRFFRKMKTKVNLLG